MHGEILAGFDRARRDEQFAYNLRFPGQVSMGKARAALQLLKEVMTGDGPLP